MKCELLLVHLRTVKTIKGLVVLILQLVAVKPLSNMMLQDDVIKRPTMNENHAKIDQIWHSYLFHVFICSSLSVLTNNLSLCSYL